MLLGTYEHNLDDKLRLTIPSKIRNQLGSLVYISKGFEGSLELRTPDEFELWTAEILSHANLNKQARAIQRLVLSNSAELEIDSSGRIKIPGNLLEVSNISKEVVILGVGSKLEIWDKITYEQYLKATSEEMENIAQELEKNF